MTDAALRAAERSEDSHKYLREALRAHLPLPAPHRKFDGANQAVSGFPHVARLRAFLGCEISREHTEPPVAMQTAHGECYADEPFSEWWACFDGFRPVDWFPALLHLAKPLPPVLVEVPCVCPTFALGIQDCCQGTGKRLHKTEYANYFAVWVAWLAACVAEHAQFHKKIEEAETYLGDDHPMVWRDQPVLDALGAVSKWIARPCPERIDALAAITHHTLPVYVGGIVTHLHVYRAKSEWPQTAFQAAVSRASPKKILKAIREAVLA